MADTDDFASVDDLEASWHALTDEEKTRAKKLIAYASDLIRSYRRWDKVSSLTRERICCAAVRRAMEADSNGAPSGASSMSETAGPFQATYSFQNPTGDLRLRPSEEKELGGRRRLLAGALDMSTGKVVAP